MYPQCTNALIQTTTVDVDPHPEQEQRVIAESTKPPTVSEQRVIVESTNPSTVSEQRVSANSEIQPAIEMTNMQTYETSQAPINKHHDTAPPSNVLLQETVNVPNTLISARNRSRHTVTRPPAITDRVTRLDTKKTLAQASQTSATLNLDGLGKPLKYRTAKAGPNTTQWQKAEGEEIQRLIDTHTIRAIHPHEQPIERKGESTYYNPQVKEKTASDGSTTYRVRGTIGGDRILYPGPTTARTAAMPLVKLLIQSVVSDNKRFMTLDIKDFYLNTPLDRSEYLRISAKFLPSQIIMHNNLQPYLQKGSILFEVNKGMYGLPQAGLLAQNRLITHLATHGYHQTKATCLFRHETNGTDFSLVVDDFGVKYSNKSGAQHLIDTLQQLYIITIDWTGSKYLGFSIVFDHDRHTVDLSMPGYIDKVLQRFSAQQTRGAASPALYTPPSYRQPDQRPVSDDSPPLTPVLVHQLQEIVGCLLYYARGIDITILIAVKHLASLQANPTNDTMKTALRLIAYCARYPNNFIRYHACDMILHIQSDASYLSRPEARSVAGGIFYVGNHDQPTTINGAIHAISSIIPAVVASVAEAEYAALFLNGQEGASLRHILNALGYPQPATVILCDNKCAHGIATDTIKPKRTKGVDMKFHWIRDRIRQGQFQVMWRKGVDNLAE